MQCVRLIPDLQFVGNKVAVVSLKEPFEQNEIHPKQKLCSQIFNQQQHEAYTQLCSGAFCWKVIDYKQ